MRSVAGETWTREPVRVPEGSEGHFRIVALAATAKDRAWAIAQADPALGRGILVLQRETGADGPEWVERDLGAPTFARWDTPAEAVAGVAPLGGSAQTLTAVEEDLWVDGRLESGGAEREFTLFFDAQAGRVTGSWCDAPVCERPLASRLSTGVGYRSFAWTGEGFGTRVVTNPLDPGGDDRANRGTYLRLTGGEFRRMPGRGRELSPERGLRLPGRRLARRPGPDLRGWRARPAALVAGDRSRPALRRGRPARRPAGRPRLRGARRRPRRRRRTLPPGAGMETRVPAQLERERQQGLAARGGVARARSGPCGGGPRAMWQWNADNDLWEADPGAPVGFEGNLMDVAFQPGNPERGYAVGKAGTILRYGKSWDPEALPAGFAGRDLTQVAFAGSQAIVAAGDALLVNDGAGWQVDASAKALLNRVRPGQPRLVAVAGLPDGGAVAAGRDIVIERDGPGRPWRFSDQPLPGSSVIALGAFRSGAPDRPVRAVASVAPRTSFPPPDEIPTPDPNVPPPIIPTVPAAGGRLRAARDRHRLGGRAADILQRLRERSPDQVRPDPELRAGRCGQRLGRGGLERRQRQRRARLVGAQRGGAAQPHPGAHGGHLPLRRRLRHGSRLGWSRDGAASRGPGAARGGRARPVRAGPAPTSPPRPWAPIER